MNATEPTGRGTTARAFLRSALVARRGDIAVASLLYSLHQLGEAMVPVIIGATIGQAIGQANPWRILAWLAVLGADFVLLSLSYRFGARVSMRAKQHVAFGVRMRVVERIVHPAGGLRRQPGELLTRATSDADRVGALAGVVAQTIAAAVVLVVTTVLLLRYSALLGAMIPIGTIVLLAVTGRVSRRLHRHSDAEQRGSAGATALAEDLLRGLRVLKGIGAEDAASAGYARASQVAADSAIRALSSQAALSALGTLFTGAYLTFIAALGGWFALTGSLGVGALVAALGLAAFLIGPLQTLSAISGASARALASAGRVCELLDASTAIEDAPTAAPTDPDRGLRGDVEFDAASIVGRSLSFVARAGELTGIVAEDSAVAGEIAELLAREHDPVSGHILIGGTRIDAVPLGTLRGAVLVSAHDAALFPGTIGENIAVVARSETARERGTWAAFADQVIETVAGGVDARLGDAGQGLSGGQLQRVALARALAAEAPILVLHDPTTAVDAATESLIADRLRTIRQGLTTIVLTSSPALLSRCDRVVLVGGDGARSARHSSLIRESGLYRELVAR